MLGGIAGFYGSIFLGPRIGKTRQVSVNVRCPEKISSGDNHTDEQKKEQEEFKVF